MRSSLCFSWFIQVLACPLTALTALLWLYSSFETQHGSAIALGRTTGPSSAPQCSWHDIMPTHLSVASCCGVVGCFITPNLTRRATCLWDSVKSVMLFWDSLRCFNRSYENMCLKEKKKKESPVLSKCKMRVSRIGETLSFLHKYCYPKAL